VIDSIIQNGTHAEMDKPEPPAPPKIEAREALPSPSRNMKRWFESEKRRPVMARGSHYDAIAQRAGVPVRSRIVRFAEADRAEVISRMGGEPVTDRERFLVELCVQRAVALELARAGLPAKAA
jgi:hypothetical protein